MKEIIDEQRVFLPSEGFRKNAWIKDEKVYEEGEDYIKFWEKRAEEMIDWYKKWDKVLEVEEPYYKWFINGKLNASYNCLDRWIERGKGDKLAYIWEGELGEVRKLTYKQLYGEVCKFANALKSLGVKKGDIVSIYLPMIPELPIAMLACARIGAPHSVIFAGFSAEAFKDRVEDAGAKYVITCDGYYRRGKLLNHKEKTDEGLKNLDVEKVIVVKRADGNVSMQEGRDVWWDDLVKEQPAECEPEVMDAEDLLFLMYTSGTTGKPKGVMHTTGGYMVGVATTMKWVFDVKDEDVYWCTADIGWITGHSYIVYGPLANAVTSVMYEGAPDYPQPDRWWEIVEKYKVTILYTAPTAIRLMMKWGEKWPNMHDLSSLRLLGSVGEPINPEAWLWYYKVIGKERCPIVDTWWMTETGMHIITPLPGITKLKPGSAAFPFPGLKAEVRDENGVCPPGQKGELVITRPWPSMLRGLYNAHEKYVEEYWSKYGFGNFYTGDGAMVDEDGYFWLLGRIGDVINVAGHRLGTAEVESALVSHESVAEAAVVGIPHEIKGQVPFAYVVLKEGVVPSEELKQELIKHVVKVIGPTAKPDGILFVSDLPKTRSGKIMRRILRGLAENGEIIGDITTLRNPEVVHEIKEALEKRKV
ncbi:MAG: acetate--CoA ligase [Thermoplasmata archaeon]|nr:MAG: acetate--CoA ligase [Thermoplasmata archaeon]KAA0015104.1 MAG: acetate--CoA ligase [Thermoplasmata archaeon]